MQSLAEFTGLLRCPENGEPLRLLTAAEAEQAMGGELAPRRNGPKPFGVTEVLLVRADHAVAYPVVDGVPILVIPEQVRRASEAFDVDLTQPRYAEAYEEIEFYNEVAAKEAEDIRRSESYTALEPALRPGVADSAFPEPRDAWLDAVPDCKSQFLGYRHLGRPESRRLLQVGGKGLHAVKWLVAGGAEAWVLTPMLGEALCSMALAREVGVEDRLRCVVGVAEEIPVVDEAFDAVYSGGCVHHMVTEIAFPEIARTLKPGGRFGASEPWRAPLYSVGTRVLGKREESVFCRPLTTERVAQLESSFSSSEVRQFGAITRYPVLALTKFGVHLPLKVVWWLYRLDDRLAAMVPPLKRYGSGVALLATK